MHAGGLGRVGVFTAKHVFLRVSAGEKKAGDAASEYEDVLQLWTFEV